MKYPALDFSECSLGYSQAGWILSVHTSVDFILSLDDLPKAHLMRWPSHQEDGIYFDYEPRTDGGLLLIDSE